MTVLVCNINNKMTGIVCRPTLLRTNFRKVKKNFRFAFGFQNLLYFASFWRTKSYTFVKSNRVSSGAPILEDREWKVREITRMPLKLFFLSYLPSCITETTMIAWILCGLSILFAWKLWSFFKHYFLMPRYVRACFLQQGITGPPALPVVGNMLQIFDLGAKEREKDFSEITHDIVDHVMPELKFYSKHYGNLYLTWFGDEPRVVIDDPDMIRDVLCKKSGHFGKSPLMRKYIEEIVGDGLVTADGEDWAQRRGIMSPAFHAEKLKTMVSTIVNCTLQMVERWELAIKERGPETEIEVLEQLNCLTADVISHTAFGSSYEKGQKVFQLMHSVEQMMPKVRLLNLLPGGRLIPIPVNLQLRNIKKQLNSILGNMVKERRNSVQHNDEYGHDLLGLMLTEAAVGEKSHGTFGDKKLIEECKTFYVAGHETTSTLLTWALMLLARYPMWQDVSRNEVQEVHKGNVPDVETLGKLKTVTMVIHETLRLYPPATFASRHALKETNLGKLFIPKGTTISIPILALHHDPFLWGPDVNEFNPDRFAHGIANACKHPMAFIPFVAGPRVCVGQAFAVMEAKIVLAIILSRFKFHLSPNYIHNPTTKVTLRPHHGMPLIFERL